MMALNLSRRLVLAAPVLLPSLGRPATAATDDKVLRVVAPWDYDSADPIDTGYILTRMGIGETLVMAEPSGRLVGGLAESWTVDPDHLTWRFRIRDARFHDGTKVTAAIIATGLQRVQPKAETLSTIPFTAIEPNGEGELILRTRTPFAPLPAFLVDYAGVILAPSAYDGARQVVRPVATGAYRVTAIDGTKVVEAEAFEGHWGIRPVIGRVRYTAAVQGDTRANLAEAGEADLTFTLLPQAAERIEAGGRARILRATIPRVRMFTMNLALPQFADVRVRQALSLAIDRAGIARTVLRDPASAATQLLPPVLSGWHDPTLPPLRRDVAEARRLLTEAGWQPGADGVMTRDGQRLAFGVLIPSNRPEIPIMGQAIQAEMREIGVAVELRPGPSSGIPAAARNGTLQAALLARTYVNVPDPIGTILPDYASDATIWASTGYRSAEMRKLVTDYIENFDEGDQASLRRGIVGLLQRDLPVIPVSWFQHNAAASTRLDPASLELDPFEMSYRLAGMRWAA
jgi:peptide/nickel transport system substrate-binding protein